MEILETLASLSIICLDCHDNANTLKLQFAYSIDAMNYALYATNAEVQTSPSK
jgi:hypothetical protein